MDVNVFSKLDPYRRYQRRLAVIDIFPSMEGLCAYCLEKPLTGHRRRWCSNECSRKAVEEFHVIKGDYRVIRYLLWMRDKGVCNSCKEYASKWEADHILAVKDGGGACDLDNFQTLCIRCHKAKTKSSLEPK